MEFDMTALVDLALTVASLAVIFIAGAAVAELFKSRR
jgi:hypothetical protein